MLETCNFRFNKQHKNKTFVCYFGELAGMVGSMETIAPSGPTSVMAVFL